MFTALFKRDDDKPAADGKDPAPTIARPIARRRGGGAAVDLSPAQLASYIEVSVTTTPLSPAVEQAAMMYAEGQMEATLGALMKQIEGEDGTHDVEAWFMLFDLFQVLGQREQFEKLADAFALRVGRSAPTWDGNDNAAVATSAPRTVPIKRVVPQSLLARDVHHEITELRKALETKGLTILDLSHVTEADEVGCRILADALAWARQNGAELSVAETGHFEQILTRHIKDPESRLDEAFWHTLLEIAQMTDRPTLFEDLAVEYGVAFEVSPPTWDPPAVKVSVDARASADGGGIIALSGNLLGPIANETVLIQNASRAKPSMTIDLWAVPRVNFAAAAALLNTIERIAAGGQQRVVVDGANALIRALFAMVGIARIATITRNKQH